MRKLKTMAKSPAIGARVQIPAYTDAWARGARFGTVSRVKAKAPGVAPHADLFGVRMDNPRIRRLVWVVADDCRYVRA